MSRKTMVLLVVAAVLGVLTAVAAGKPKKPHPVKPPTTTTTPTTTTPPASEWQLVLSDDFSGGFDTARWAKYGPNWPGHAGNGIRDGVAVSVVNGILTITARMYSGALSNGVQVSNKLVSGAAYPLLPSQTYGRYEVRVRTDRDPDGVMSGVCLTWPDDNVFPQHGELDWYETGQGGGRLPTYSYVHHWGATVGSDQTQLVHNVDGSQWHTFAMEWRPGSVRVFVDGVLDGTVTDRVPQGPMHMVLQHDAFASAISGPRKMEVDYAMVWTYTGPR